MSPDETIWSREPHTAGKHQVLERYLKAWFAILGSTQQRILFIDGFAGPGEYSGGELGSPLIALKVLSEHSFLADIRAEIVYIFVEKDRDRWAHLQQRVAAEYPKLPSNCHVQVINKAFDETMTTLLDSLDKQARRLAPAFVMMDPFGVSGTPMSVVRRILQNPKSELYISFMYEAVNRFIGTREFEKHLDSLFGCPDWQTANAIKDSEERKRFLYDLYESQLRKAGAKYVLHFELYKGNRLVYAIFFATQNDVGCNKMKEAIWKVAPEGDYCFRAKDDRQLRLDLCLADLEPFQLSLQRKFGGAGWVTIEEVEAFVRGDAVPYHTGQLRVRTLKPMERAGIIEVDATSRKKHLTYPNGARIRFKAN